MNKDFLETLNRLAKEEQDKILAARKSGDTLIIIIKRILANGTYDKELITLILNCLESINKNATYLSKMYSSHSEDFKFLISVCKNKIEEINKIISEDDRK